MVSIACTEECGDTHHHTSRSSETVGFAPASLYPRCDSADAVYMLALSIRQPYAELILRGEKRIEYRSRPTKVIGQRFYIYAARTPGKWAGVNGVDVSPSLAGRGRGGGSCNVEHDTSYAVDDLTHPLTPSPPRPICDLKGGGNGALHLNGLRRGVIVGSAAIAKCVQHNGLYEWHLTDVKRYKRPRKVKRQPQPVWFRPF